ncbi:uncharacterized protein LOC111088091, partial [Limulus polyphemus]|uniref:Uncharacterized protein LOC111088091 n=1 Tax=Limulus polyphemus TaxID=6850 RepID=A0ABM1TA34_LIMPO
MGTVLSISHRKRKPFSRDYRINQFDQQQLNNVGYETNALEQTVNSNINNNKTNVNYLVINALHWKYFNSSGKESSDKNKNFTFRHNPNKMESLESNRKNIQKSLSCYNIKTTPVSPVNFFVRNNTQQDKKLSQKNSTPPFPSKLTNVLTTYNSIRPTYHNVVSSTRPASVQWVQRRTVVQTSTSEQHGHNMVSSTRPASVPWVQRRTVVQTSTSEQHGHNMVSSTRPASVPWVQRRTVVQTSTSEQHGHNMVSSTRPASVPWVQRRAIVQ